jgi:hypothetical protein
MTRFAMLLLSTLALAGHAAAQQASPAPGDRVRLTLTTPAAGRVGTGRVDARLLRATGDSLALDTTVAGAPFVVSTADVAKFERYDGRRSSAGKGAVIGLGIGALAGGVAAFAFSNAGGSCDGSLSDIACEETAGTMGLAGAAAGGVLGLLLGAVAGAASSGDSWTPVGAPVRVTPTVIRGVPGIAMRMEF